MSLSRFSLLARADLTVASASSVLLRQKIVKKCRDDILHFLLQENGQIAIYDAVNPLASGRRSLAKEFAKHNIEVSWTSTVGGATLTPPTDALHRIDVR